MKQLVLSTLMLALPLFACAYDVEVDGIYYNLISKGNIAEVTSGDSKYSGEVNLPYKINCDGIEYTVKSIGSYAFNSCPLLTSVTIPHSITSIGDWAFQWSKSITSIVIPNSVTTIGTGAFENCRGLSSVVISNSVTSIGNYVFDFCSSLTSVIIPNSVKTIGLSAFQGCCSLTYISIPNSVTSIDWYAFSGCTGLTTITIPNSVVKIGICAFEGCSELTSLTIGKSVNNIGKQAFAKCNKLETVYCYTTNVPSTNTTAFQDSYPQYATLYVPIASINSYKNTAPWSEFGIFKELLLCATPTINYENKVITFNCATKGVEYVSNISDVDIKDYFCNNISLSATYEISVYATKSGYENSDIATATLVWMDAIFTETTEASTSAKAVTESIPVLISAQGGTITVKSEQEGQSIAVYSTDGKALGNTSICGGHATIATNLQSGQLAIVKVGNRSVKLKM